MLMQLKLTVPSDFVDSLLQQFDRLSEEEQDFFLDEVMKRAGLSRILRLASAFAQVEFETASD